MRSPELDSIDALLASYYEHTIVEGIRTVTTARRDALQRFLAHYGFVYDVSTDYSKYPFLVKQDAPRKRVRSEVARFARVWAFRANPFGGGKTDTANVDAMVHQFLYWLESQTIENGALVEP